MLAGSVLVFGGRLASLWVSVPVGQVCDCCMLVASSELDQLESRNLWGG